MMGQLISHQYKEDDVNCFKPTLANFPGGLFSHSTLEHGIIAIHFAIALYLFAIVALLIHAYVVSGIKTLADNYRIASESARNTIVICGQLLPEFFCSLIGVFVSKGSLGATTVIGSCAANSLLTLGVVGLIVSGPVKLSWYPLWRDNIFYLITVTILLWSTFDHLLKWQESLFLVLVYFIYILIINFNHKIERGVRRIVFIYRTGDDDHEADLELEKPQVTERRKERGPSRRGSTRSLGALYMGETIPEENSDDIRESSMDDVEKTRSSTRPSTRENSRDDLNRSIEYSKDDLFDYDDVIAIRRQGGILRQSSHEGTVSLCTEDGYTTGDYGGYTSEDKYSERGYLSERGYHSERGYGSFRYGNLLNDHPEGYASEGDYNIASSPRGPEYRVKTFARHAQHLTNRMKHRKIIKGSYYITLDMDQYVNGPKSPFTIPDRWYYKPFWIASLPAVCIFYVTIPDCRKPKWRSWYPMTLFTSALWVAILSYILVWIAVDIGFTLKVPDGVMGFAFLATGLSFSGIINTYLASQAGHGNSAVYSIYGSNVFNITINLGLVWFIRSIASNPFLLSNGSIVYVNLCQLIIVLTPLLLQFTRWRLNKVLGVVYLFLYCCFTTIVVLLEFDIIGNFNPPICEK